MNMKEYFDKMPLSTKIVAGILIGVILAFVIYTYQVPQQTSPGQTWEDRERQEQIDAANAKQESDKQLKELEEGSKKLQEDIDRDEQKRYQQQQLNELRAIREGLERR
ncbi:MAG: hypothetical protein WB948_08020 [Desulfobaccales bacterium]